MGVPVFLYVPNLIGYTRIVLGVGAFAFTKQPQVFMALYFASQALDAVDGVCARALGQTSQFGSVLDMVTDRFSTMLLTTLVGKLWEERYGDPGLVVVAGLVALDLVSHWYAMYANMLEKGRSHKDMSRSGTPAILQFYYTQAVLFVTCSLSEVYLLLVYGMLSGLLPRDPLSPLLPGGSPIVRVLGAASLAVYLFKQVTSFVQMTWAMARVAAVDEKGD